MKMNIESKCRGMRDERTRHGSWTMDRTLQVRIKSERDKKEGRRKEEKKENKENKEGKRK